MTANIAIAQLMLSALLVSVTFIWGIFRYRRADYHRRDRYKKLQAYLLWGLSGLITISTFYPLSFLYTEHLWSENLGVADVFWGLHKIRWGFFALCFIVAAGFMNINAAIANILCPESREFRRWTHIRTFSFHRTVIGITIVLGLLMAAPMLLLDDIVLRYLHQPERGSRSRRWQARCSSTRQRSGCGSGTCGRGSALRERPEFLSVQLPDAQMDEPLDTDSAVGDRHRCRVAV